MAITNRKRRQRQRAARKGQDKFTPVPVSLSPSLSPSPSRRSLILSLEASRLSVPLRTSSLGEQSGKPSQVITISRAAGFGDRPPQRRLLRNPHDTGEQQVSPDLKGNWWDNLNLNLKGKS